MYVIIKCVILSITAKLTAFMTYVSLINKNTYYMYIYVLCIYIIYDVLKFASSLEQVITHKIDIVTFVRNREPHLTSLTTTTLINSTPVIPS